MDGPEEVGRRLRHLRVAYGHKAKTFANLLGIAETTWNNFERGKRRISIDEAIKVAAKTGASLDWIYRGLEGTLPLHVVEKLHKADAEGATRTAVNE